MPTIPSHHDVGDEGHTTDHNSMADVLTDHATSIGTLQTAQPTYYVKSGGNTINLANPAGTADAVVIPSGTRDTAAYVRTVTYGGKRTFGLDTYGQLRCDAAQPNLVPVEVAGFDASQSADLQRWRTYGAGGIVARVANDGTIYAPNITPGVWTNITLAAGIAWYSPGGAVPQYRLVGDCVELRGAVHHSNSSDFTGSGSPVGTLPPQACPPNLIYSVQASELGSGMASVRTQIATTGLIQFSLITPSGTPYTPAWMSLDGIRYSRTA